MQNLSSRVMHGTRITTRIPSRPNNASFDHAGLRAAKVSLDIADSGTGCGVCVLSIVIYRYLKGPDHRTISDNYVVMECMPRCEVNHVTVRLMK